MSPISKAMYILFYDAQVDVSDVRDHDDVKITECVVNDSMLARSHLTEDFGCEVLPTPVCKELKTLRS